MRLSKAQREIVWQRSQGKCWYCGEDLPEKGWHADHYHPVLRESEPVKDKATGLYKFAATGKTVRPHNNSLDNMVPACAPCNLFKSSYSAEFFRLEIQDQADRVRKASSGFRIAERMGLIAVTDSPVVFWFERHGLSAPEEPTP